MLAYCYSKFKGLKLLLIYSLLTFSLSWKTSVEDLDDHKYFGWIDQNGTELKSFTCNLNIEILGGVWKANAISKVYELDESTDEILLELTYYINSQAFITIVVNNQVISKKLITDAGQTNSKDFINCNGNYLYFQTIQFESILNTTTSSLKIDIFIDFSPDSGLFLGFYKLKIKVPGINEGILSVIIIIPSLFGIGLIGYLVWKAKKKIYHKKLNGRNRNILKEEELEEKERKISIDAVNNALKDDEIEADVDPQKTVNLILKDIKSFNN